MQRPATVRHRTSLFEDATSIVEAEYASDLSLDDIARRVASSRRQLQRAYAEIGNTTFREHLTAVRMERAAEMLRSRGADRARGRPPGRLPPARAVRQGLPPPPRRLALGLPVARAAGRLRRRLAHRPSARLSAPPGGSVVAVGTYRVALCRGRPIGCRGHAGGEHAAPRAQAHGPADGRRRRHRLRDRHRDRPAIDWFPPADSTQADKIDTLWDVLIIASVPVFVLVTVIVCFSVLEFRMRPGEENLDGPPIHGNTRLEVIWTAVPAILIVGLVTYAYVVLRDIEKAPAAGNERVVDVTGQQFTWTFAYNEGGKKFTTAQLYLPAGKSVKFDVRSKDVIHDFWVPDFRMKIDAVPGITTHYRVTPKNPRLGDHAIVCAELCGLGHAFMRQTAHVLAPGRVRQVGAEDDQPARPAAGGGGGGGAAVDAKALFTNGDADTGATACGTCHTLADAGAKGQVGPDLDKVLKGKDAAFIKESIVDPDTEIAKGFQAGVMPPNFGETLSAEQVDALVKYLSEVTNK